MVQTVPFGLVGPQSTGPDITRNSHLPLAVGYGDETGFDEFDDPGLLTLQKECAAWRLRHEEFGGQIHSPSGKAIWRALGASDFDRVQRCSRRIDAEIARRAASVATADLSDQATTTDGDIATLD